MDIRVATFNATLNRNAEGEHVAHPARGTESQPRAVAEIIQRTAAALFQSNDLSVGQNGAGLILVSSRGNSTFKVHDRTDPGTFAIGDGAATDGVGETGGAGSSRTACRVSKAGCRSRRTARTKCS